MLKQVGALSLTPQQKSYETLNTENPLLPMQIDVPTLPLFKDFRSESQKEIDQKYSDRYRLLSPITRRQAQVNA